jgi:probable F420-dependent oxidoreductase
MKFGLIMYPVHHAIDPVTLGRAAEERGFESLFFPEHTHIPVASRRPGGTEARELDSYAHAYDPFVALSAVAATTSTLRLGTGVCLVVQRDPIITAKEVASLDHLSGGRFLFGVGAGWNQEEMANHGIDPRTRTRRMLEHIAAIREIWTQDEAEFHGEFVDFDPIWSWPKPVRTPPVLIGGEGPTVLDRVLSHGDGWMPRSVSGDDVAALAARIAELRRRGADAGRGHLTVTVFGAAPDKAVLDAYADAGVDRVLYSVPDAGADEVLHTLDELAALRA